MSRSGYTDDCDDNWSHIRWRGAVSSAIYGKRGQSALREIIAALDALPEKRLAPDSLETADGDYCTLGALGRFRGLEMGDVEPDDLCAVSDLFGIAKAMSAEIMHINDEHISEWDWVHVRHDSPPRLRFEKVHVPDAAEKRWKYMRDWCESKLIKEKVTP
jgi:hypothetical protein